MKIAVLANLKSDAPKSPNDPPGRWDDLDTMETVEAIVGAIQSFGHVVRYLPADNRLPSGLDDFQPDFCFNYSVGHFGEHRLAWVPELLDSRLSLIPVLRKTVCIARIINMWQKIFFWRMDCRRQNLPWPTVRKSWMSMDCITPFL